MWILLAVFSALSLGFYDISKKLSLQGNNVLKVLFLNTLFCSLLMSPIILFGMWNGSFGLGNSLYNHGFIFLKAIIVLASWICGYYSIKYLPLTIASPISASRPVMVLAGAVLIFGERLNLMQWAGVILGFVSLFLISRVGKREGSMANGGKWVWLAIAAAIFGAISALYDKYLMGHFEPLEVQAWYNLYQLILMGGVLIVMMQGAPATEQPLKWRWSILLISLFLTAADLAYFYALSIPGSMVAVVSMIRRGSVLVSFFFGVIALHEKDVRAKLLDLGILLLGLVLLIIGSN